MYRGWMRTSYLNDRQIRPTEYRKWRDARRYFESRPKEWAKVERLMSIIAADGLPEPIRIGVSDRYPDVYVGDGHHRAVALLELGLPKFPFHWYWIKSWGRPRMENKPFPFHLLDQ